MLLQLFIFVRARYDNTIDRPFRFTSVQIVNTNIFMRPCIYRQTSVSCSKKGSNTINYIQYITLHAFFNAIPAIERHLSFLFSLILARCIFTLASPDFKIQHGFHLSQPEHPLALIPRTNNANGGTSSFETLACRIRTPLTGVLA